MTIYSFGQDKIFFLRHHTLKEEKEQLEKYFKLAQKMYEIAPSTFANAFVNDRPFVTSNIIIFKYLPLLHCLINGST